MQFLLSIPASIRFLILLIPISLFVKSSYGKRLLRHGIIHALALGVLVVAVSYQLLTFRYYDPENCPMPFYALQDLETTEFRLPSSNPEYYQNDPSAENSVYVTGANLKYKSYYHVMQCLYGPDSTTPSLPTYYAELRSIFTTAWSKDGAVTLANQQIQMYRVDNVSYETEILSIDGCDQAIYWAEPQPSASHGRTFQMLSLVKDKQVITIHYFGTENLKDHMDHWISLL